MNLLQGVGNRIGAVVGAVIAAIFMLLCGAILAFVVSPGQALEWRRIQNLPELDANGVAALPAGQDLAVTGHLSGNEALTGDGLVLYSREKWTVKQSSNENDNTPHGTWETVEEKFPDLSVDMS